MASPKTRLATWIEESGFSYAEVAGLTGYSKSMIALVARGKRNLSPEGKVKVSRRLGVRLGALFDAEADDKVAAFQAAEDVDKVPAQ